MRIKLLAAMAFCSTAACAQQYEIGGAFGYGWYRNGTVFGPGSSAPAGIRNRFAAGAVVGEDLYEHVAGEVRYVYHDGDPFVGAGAQRSDAQGQSHTLTYDVLLHLKRRESRLRPFFAAGVGAKGYIVSGPVPSQQPLGSLAGLATHDEWKVVVDVGVGVKYRLVDHLLLRVDFRDYMTGFPSRQIVPAQGNTARGILHQFTPMVGLSAWF